MFFENEVVNYCCCCGAEISVSESICSFCLMDKQRESEIEDYNERISQDW